MTLPVVSVIIPSYNSATFVAEAVESALAQTYKLVEVIVVDDGSTDETSQVLAPYRPQIRYIHQPNEGLSGARNRGIAEATGELLAFLDADDKWLPSKLAQQVERLRANPLVGLVHTDFLHWDSATGALLRKDRPRHEYVGKCYERFFWGNVFCPSTVLLRRECLCKVGLFDKAIRRPSVQDYDLWLRVARHFELAYIDDPLALYRCHNTNASKNTLMMKQDELYVIQKALHEDPTLWEAIGQEGVRSRLFDLYFSLGYLQFDAGSLIEAHHRFAQALHYRPGRVYAWALWLATLLPPPTVHRLRALKQRWIPGAFLAGPHKPPCLPPQHSI